MEALPPVAVTCGDPSGIGPEIARAAWSALRGELSFFLIGDPAQQMGANPVEIADPSEAAAAMSRGLPILPHAFPAKARPGAPNPENARTVVEVIERGVGLVLAGKASALTTAPISKKGLADHGGFAFPGHTEFLASLSGAAHPVMMLASDELRVVPVTIHMPLAEVPIALTPERLESTIRITEAALRRDFAIAAPRIAVSGLNPHAGEGGMLGAEDRAIIAPVIARLKAEGMDLSGPLPADTMFHAEARAGYDAAIAMYHDQALIPIKTLAFDRGVNVTLGLPFVRTSPDHGTAFDIAGQSRASPTSMIEALRLAARMARARALADT